MVSNPEKFQHHLSTDIGLARANEFVDSAKSHRDEACIRLIYRQGAGAWLDTAPTSDKNTLKPSEFYLVSCLRIGQPLSYSKWITKCDYGAEIDEYRYHLTCKYRGGPVWGHNSIVSRDRPDIVV